MRIIFCLLIHILPVLATANTLEGVVVGISDGDTITVLGQNNINYKVRFAQIDSPEKNQPWGQRSKQALSDLVYRKTVVVEIVDKDRYGRIVGTVWVNGINANKEQIKFGNAWVYRQYLKDRSLLAVEVEAKAAKRGLWALPEAQRIPPWDWRRGGTKAKSQVSQTTVSAAKPLRCGNRRTCYEMQDCADAKYYLNTCNVRSLDHDHDGIPCESLCR